MSLSNRMTLYIELDYEDPQLPDGDYAIRIYSDNVTYHSGPAELVMDSVTEVGPAVQEIVERNVRNMISNAENRLAPLAEEKERLEKFLGKYGEEA